MPAKFSDVIRTIILNQTKYNVRTLSVAKFCVCVCVCACVCECVCVSVCARACVCLQLITAMASFSLGR